MNNKEAFVLLNSKPSIRAATDELLDMFQQPESEFHFISRKFRELKSSRESYVKKSNLSTWEHLMFYSPRITQPAERIPPVDNIFTVDLSAEIRKDLSRLTLKGLRTRLAPLLQLIRQIAEKEDVSAKTIAAHALQLISNESKDLNTANFCKEIISKGTFAANSKVMSIDKSTFMLDLLEIGKQKYTSFRLICKSEDIIFPSYSKLAEYRKDAVLVNELTYVNNVHNVTIGISISYRRILFQSLLRLFQTLPPIVDSEYPLSVKIADGLDGSGCHQIYNHYQLNPTPSSKNFILFAFKIISIQNSSNIHLWKNNSPNSSFCVRPVVLLAQKECIENVKFIMTNYINPEVCVIEQEGIQFPEGVVRVKIIRSMLDGKMSGILSGAGGASCQLCTAHKQELKDLELVRAGFPINRHISDAKELFNYVDKDEYLSLSHVDRLGMTHEPLSDINILSASPLHSYTCVFHWFMLLVYHLKSGRLVWSPTSKPIETAKKFCSGFLFEKTGLRIDQPTSQGGTTSTGNIARQCFSNKNDFITSVFSLIPAEFREQIAIIQMNLSVILRVFNSSQEVETDKMDVLCKQTYELILIAFPWASITPSLHKILAHSTELIRDCNDGYGLKEYSEEAVEACNKLIRRYREHLSRKNSFSLNIRDVFVRLLSQSDPLFPSYRRV